MRTHAIIVGLVGLLAMQAPAHAQSEVLELQPKGNKQSIYDLGEQGLENLKKVGHGYGTAICGEKHIARKEDIKVKAWSRIQRSCGKFTFGLQANFTDDPNRIFSMCIGAALDGCQRAIGIERPCDNLKSCQALLGVPD